ncbi:hypothetical protein AVEN_118245-1 [Araneus ventricosus]|nr:hypothetical protein AVEN_118245-1 [Araneus ventricosus]
MFWLLHMTSETVLRLQQNVKNQKFDHRKKKKLHGYESLDEAPPKEIQTKLLFFFILEVTINSFQERFDELNAIYEKKKWFFLSNIKKAKHDKILGMFNDLHLALSDGNHNDVDDFQIHQ